jgi:hypothetical protein
MKPPLAIGGPTPPAPPGSGDESPLVPPRPPEPGGVAVSPPVPPAPPVVEESRGVEPAGGFPPRRKPATPAPATTPAAPPKTEAPAAPLPGGNLAPLKKLAQAAAATAKTLDNYEARFSRRENVDGTPGKLEEVIFKYRAEPMAVYMKNVSDAGKGREVLYNPNEYGDKVHVIVGEGDTRFLKAGSKGPSLSPDNPQVRSKSRHSIRESGIAITTGKFLDRMAKLEGGRIPAEIFKYAGPVKREDLADLPLEGVEETIRKGDDPALPNGGTRHWFFDAKPGSPSHGLPVLTILYDSNGKELEYYRYTQFKVPGNFTAADFDPSKMGKK